MATLCFHLCKLDKITILLKRFPNLNIEIQGHVCCTPTFHKEAIDKDTRKRELSKNTVLLFNDTVKANLSDEKLKNFIEVSEIINQLITDKKIFRDK